MKTLAETPGIYSVSCASPACWRRLVRFDHSRAGIAAHRDRAADVDQTYVSPRYFETVGAGLRGREFDRNDTAASPKVASSMRPSCASSCGARPIRKPAG